MTDANALMLSGGDRRRISRRAMAGYDPTAEEQAMLAADMPALERNQKELALNALMSMIPGGAVARGLSAARGIPLALASTLGMSFGANEGEAQSRGRGAQVDPADAAAAAKLPEHLRPQYIDLAARNRMGALNRAERQQFMQMNTILSQSAAAGDAAAQQREANALTMAEEAKMKVMREAPQTFQERFGNAASYAPIAPLAAAFTTMLPTAVRGAMGKSAAAGEWRAATRAGLEATDAPTMALNHNISQGIAKKFPEPSVGNALTPYAIPATIGGIEGAAIANIPDEWNASLPPINPERAAYEAYLKELRSRLPPDHPAIARAESVMGGLPEMNPARKASLDYFSNPGQVIAKTGVGALQGAGGGALAASIGKWFHPSEGILPRGQTAALANRVAGSGVDDALAAVEKEAVAMRNVVPLPVERQRLQPLPQTAGTVEVPMPPRAPAGGYDPLAVQGDKFEAEIAAIKALIEQSRR